MIKGPCVCQFPSVGLHDGFYVTVGKASGERPYEQINTTQPEITLILSYSSYHLSIRAVNNASTSPPQSLTVPQREQDIPSERSLIKAALFFFFNLSEELLENTRLCLWPQVLQTGSWALQSTATSLSPSHGQTTSTKVTSATQWSGGRRTIKQVSTSPSSRMKTTTWPCLSQEVCKNQPFKNISYYILFLSCNAHKQMHRCWWYMLVI